MSQHDFRAEVERALETSEVVAKEDYLRWARSGDLPTQARAHELSSSAWDRIQPEPSMDEQCQFMATYLLSSIEQNLPSDAYVQSGFEAGYYLAAWLKHLAGLPGTTVVIADVTNRLAHLYKKLDAQGRNRLETGTLEHNLERPALRACFEFWKDDPVLREAYEPALEWGLAHSDEAD